MWMGNTRGNTYSRRTTKGLFPYQAEFWYFSMDEMALNDVPAMVDYALQHTGARQLAYVGHSQVRILETGGGFWWEQHTLRICPCVQLHMLSRLC